MSVGGRQGVDRRKIDVSYVLTPEEDRNYSLALQFG